MDEFHASGSTKCFCCFEKGRLEEKSLKERTKYSGKPIYEIFETFIDYKITENILRKAVICRTCIDKLNEYDEHQTIANLIREELSRKHRNIPSPFVSIKLEIEQPPDIYLDEHKEIVQVKLEENVSPYEVCTPLQDFSMGTNEYFDDELASSNAIDVMKDCQDKLLSKTAANKKRRKYSSRQFVKDEDLSGCQIHDIDGVKHYQCEVCKKVMQRKADFIIHLHSHRTERNFICDVCGAASKTKGAMNVHKKRHIEKLYYCDVCPYQNKDKYGLQMHIHIKHLKRRDYICQLCGAAFGMINGLKAHLSQCHRNERSICCEICDFKTFNKHKLSRHMKTHSGERNFECNLCGKRFLHNYNLTAHVKHVHNRQKRPETNQQKLLCKVCGLKFPKIWKTKQHMAEVHNIVEDE